MRVIQNYIGIYTAITIDSTVAYYTRIIMKLKIEVYNKVT